MSLSTDRGCVSLENHVETEYKSNQKDYSTHDLDDSSDISEDECSSESSDDAVYISQNQNSCYTSISQCFVLHTIIEESCEESDSEVTNDNVSRPSPGSQLEKYFNIALRNQAGKSGNSKSNESSEEQTMSERNEIRNQLAASRLEKYFTTHLVDSQDSQDSEDVGLANLSTECHFDQEDVDTLKRGSSFNDEDPIANIRFLFQGFKVHSECPKTPKGLDSDAAYMVHRLMMHISSVGAEEPIAAPPEQPSAISLLESQISQLMQRVSPGLPDDPSTCSTNSTCSSSTLESTANNSDCGSDTLESLEDFTDEEENISNKNLLTLPATRKLPSYRDHRSYARVVSQGKESSISEETIFFCQQLVESLKRMSDNASPDGAKEPAEFLDCSSELSNAREYIKDQIETLMHSINTNKKSKVDAAALSNSDAPDSSDVESPRPVSKKHSRPHKTPSESGSETTVSASISIPSYDSDCTPTESEISHEMDELFVLLEGSNYIGPTKQSDDSSPGIHVSMNGTQTDKMNMFISNSDKCFPSGQSCYDLHKVPISQLPNEDVCSKISPSVQCYSLPDIVLAGPAHSSQDLNRSVSSIGKTAFDSTSTESIGTVIKAPISTISKEVTGDQDSRVGTPVPSFNSKEKASSENNLLLANYRMSAAKSRVAYAKSASNISDLETNSGSKSSSCRDTGYYSFKSSEESVQSFDDSVTSRASSLTFQRSLTSTETIPEVEEDQALILSLSSGNIPQYVSNLQGKCSTLPLNLRNRASPSGTTPRPRTFGSSFFSTSGVLRKLTALRAEETVLSHRSSPRGRLRSNRKTHSSSSEDGGKASMGSLPHIVVSETIEMGSASGQGSVSEKDSFTEEESGPDPVIGMHSRSQISLFGGRSESMSSVYSAAGGGRFGAVVVTGEILFSVKYIFKVASLEVHVKECRNLAPVDTKRNRSDPYVKVYLLPDKTKSGKRKTKVKKHSLSPVFDETLKFNIADSVLDSRTMWVSVWHSDIFGRNDFLGEVMLPLNADLLENTTLRWYPLQERMECLESTLGYKGDLILSLQFVPPKHSSSGGKGQKGSLNVLVKEARNLMATRSNGTSDPFCKSYLLPDKSKSGKQKTNVMKKTCNPKWNHTFAYDDVCAEDLKERCLELTIWDYDKITSNDFLGGVRLNLGTGKLQGKDVDWMDAQGEEATLWRSLLDRPHMWIDASLILRSSMTRRQQPT